MAQLSDLYPALVNRSLSEDGGLSNYVTFLDWLSAMPVIPSHIDRSLWSEKFSGSVGTQLIVALRFLGLLNGEEPTEKLGALVRASGEDRRHLYAELLREVYGHELVDCLASGTPGRLDTALRTLGTTTSTHDKARSFFVNLSKTAGLQIQPSISKKARIKKPSSTGKRQPRNKAEDSAASAGAAAPKNSAATYEATQADYAVAQSSLLLWGMFKKLPAPGSVWGEEERKAWKAALDPIFAIEYTLEDEEDNDEDDE